MKVVITMKLTIKPHWQAMEALPMRSKVVFVGWFCSFCLVYRTFLSVSVLAGRDAEKQV